MTRDPPCVEAERAMVGEQDAPLPAVVGEPTDRREGPAIPPTRVECPYCGKSGHSNWEVNLCSGCGERFEVSRR